MHRQPRIADASQLEIRIIHRADMTEGFGACPVTAPAIGGQTTTALTDR